jgi:hypothetical protein
MLVRPEGLGRFTVVLGEGQDTAPLMSTIRAAGGRVRSLAPRRRTLEDVFLTAVASDAGAEIS